MDHGFKKKLPPVMFPLFFELNSLHQICKENLFLMKIKNISNRKKINTLNHLVIPFPVDNPDVEIFQQSIMLPAVLNPDDEQHLINTLLLYYRFLLINLIIINRKWMKRNNNNNTGKPFIKTTTK